MSQIISEIIPRKDGKFKPVHEDMLGQKCVIIDMELGKKMFMRVWVKSDPGNSHRIFTSPVEDITMLNDGWKITTEKTVYVIRNTENGEEEAVQSDLP